MQVFYRSLWSATISGTVLGILLGIYSLIIQDKYFANGLYNFALLQFQQAFNVAAISFLVLGILFGLISIQIGRFNVSVQKHGKLILTFVGLVGFAGLALARFSGIDIPVAGIEKTTLLLRIPITALFMIFGLFMFIAVYRLTRAMLWPRGRLLGGIFCLILLGVNIVGFSAKIAAANIASKKPNVLLISIDTIRSDHLGCYGYERDTSPSLDRFAAEAIRFDKAVVPMSHTLPSHTSLFTGLNPLRHRLKMNGMKLEPDLLTLTEILKNHGYSTFAGIGSVILKNTTGMSRGFDVYDENMNGNLSRLAEDVRKSAELWLNKAGASGFFMFLHFWDPHSPYQPPAPFDTFFKSHNDGFSDLYLPTRLNHDHLKGVYGDFEDRELPKFIEKEKNLYDGEIRYLDDELGKFFDYLKEQGMWDNTLIIITGDHGESLGERGWWGHESFFEEQVLVPLLIKLPGNGRAVESVHQTVRLIDIVPTVMDLLNIGNMPEYDGKSLVDLMTVANGHGSRTTYLERRDYPDEMRIKSLDEYGKGREYAIRTDDWKLVLKELEDNELYNLKADPLETNNLISVEPDIAKSLVDSVYRWIADGSVNANTVKSNLDAETLKQLKSLGYIR
jgi:arylsulfatase A-like enzyme